MKAMGWIVALPVLTVSASGAEDAITNACRYAAQQQFGVKTVVLRDVQSFPELTPPRVRFRAFGLPSENAPGGSAFDALAIAQGKKVEDETGHRDMGTVVCEFASATAPHHLTAFDCSAFSCYVGAERLEELQVLLDRAGY